MKVKDKSEKADSKLSFQKMKIMASNLIISWQLDGETMETVTNFIFLGSKITADGDCSYEIKRCLLFGRKVMTNLDSILKSRDITLLTKVHIVSYGFSSSHVWIWELEHKERRVLKNQCFRIVVLEKTLESPLDSKEIQPVHPKGKSVLNIHWKDWSWSWNFNTLATWCKDLTHWKRHWCWEKLKAGEGEDRGWDGWVASLSQWTWVWASSRSWWWTVKPGVLQSMGHKESDTTGPLSWTEGVLSPLPGPLLKEP